MSSPHPPTCCAPGALPPHQLSEVGPQVLSLGVLVPGELAEEGEGQQLFEATAVLVSSGHVLRAARGCRYIDTARSAEVEPPPDLAQSAVSG